jgi:hypothetical protein
MLKRFIILKTWGLEIGKYPMGKSRPLLLRGERRSKSGKITGKYVRIK